MSKFSLQWIFCLFTCSTIGEHFCHCNKISTHMVIVSLSPRLSRVCFKMELLVHTLLIRASPALLNIATLASKFAVSAQWQWLKDSLVLPLHPQLVSYFVSRKGTIIIVLRKTHYFVSFTLKCRRRNFSTVNWPD